MIEHKEINGYEIHKEGGWCEVFKGEKCVAYGHVDEKMTLEEIYQEIEKEVVFSLKGTKILSYDFLNEFEGEREATIKSLATEYKCDEKDIIVTYRKPEIKDPNKTFDKKKKEMER